MIEQYIRSLCKKADIKIGGKRNQDIIVKDRRFFRRAFLEGSVGIGESYVDGWFECKKPDDFFFCLMRNLSYEDTFITRALSVHRFLANFMFNLQTIRFSKKVARRHYNVDAKIFERFLDKRMLYSCGYWDKAKTLEEAQEHKLDLIACKLDFKKGMRVLDIGCGWGGAARYFSEKYSIHVTGITIAEGQYDYAKKHNKTKNTEYILCDYRQHTGKYDAIYSIGMFEHVGVKNYKTFFRITKGNLKPEGRFLLHTIGASGGFRLENEGFIHKYIFPHGQLPRPEFITKSMQKYFFLDDWHNFGADYDKTLIEWYRRFTKAYPSFKSDYYDEHFYKIWKMYLLICAGGFRSRKVELWQILLSPKDANVFPPQFPKCR